MSILNILTWDANIVCIALREGEPRTNMGDDREMESTRHEISETADLVNFIT